jgi:hypothetical protein
LYSPAYPGDHKDRPYEYTKTIAAVHHSPLIFVRIFLVPWRLGGQLLCPMAELPDAPQALAGWDCVMITGHRDLAALDLRQFMSGNGHHATDSWQ